MVKPIYDMGLERAAALINWHTLTGCDTTGRINVKDKETCFKLFLEAEVTIIYALSQLGIGDEPTVEVLQGCEAIVCELFSHKEERALFTKAVPL